MSNVKFTSNEIEIKNSINDACISWLYEVSSELESQVKRNTRVDTGQLKSSWNRKVDEEKLRAIVGSPLQNAIWEEFGTGEHALNKDGRKTPWKYKDIKGNWHTTRGKRGTSALTRACLTVKGKALRAFNRKVKGSVK